MPKQYRLDKLEMPELEALEGLARKQIFREGLKVIALYLRAHVPDSGVPHKGKLKKSIRYNVQAGGRAMVMAVGKVKAVAPHAHLVHEGTRAHPVVLNARRSEPAKALNIPGIGFRHSAQHPGSRANPFLLRAAEVTRPDVERVMREALEAAAEAVAEGAAQGFAAR